MLKRIITALVLCVIGVLLHVYCHTAYYPIIWFLLSVIGVAEYLAAYRLLFKWHLAIPALLFASAMPFVAYYVRNTHQAVEILFFAIMVYAALLFIAAVLTHPKYTQPQIFTVFFGGVYITGAFSAMAALFNAAPSHPAAYVLMVFFGACFTDIFAYFTGYFIGKHKLAPVLSPKKTIEGSVGGLLGCVLVYVIYAFVLSKITDLTPNYFAISIAAVIISFCAQLGDLAMSKIKRENGVKDFGKLFPGHGGVLDRFDSFLIVAPIFLALMLLGEGSVFFK